MPLPPRHRYRLVLNSMLYPQKIWKDNAMVKDFEVRSGRPVVVDFPISPKSLGDVVHEMPSLQPGTGMLEASFSPQTVEGEGASVLGCLPCNRARVC